MSDRDAFRAEQQERREHGLKARHEKRLERSVRKQVAEEIALALEEARPHIPVSTDPQRREHLVQRSTLNRAARIAREIGSRDPE